MKILVMIALLCSTAFAQYAVPTIGSPVAPASASIALVNSAVGDNGGSSLSSVASGAFSLSSGNLVVAMIVKPTNPVTISTVADTAGNTYTLGTNCSNGNAFLYYAKNTTANASNVVTATFSSAGTFAAIMVHQYSGANTATPFDQCVNQFSASVTTITSSNFTPASANNVVVAVGTQTVGGHTWSAGTNYSLVAHSGTGTDAQTEQRLNAPASAQTASITYSGSSNMTMVVGVFKQ